MESKKSWPEFQCQIDPRKVAAPWLAPASGSLVLQLLKIELRRTARKVKHLNADYLVVLVEVQHHAGGDFFGFDDFGVIQPEIERVGFFIDVQFHSLPFMVRSKNTLTTRFGSTDVFTATRRIRPPSSGMGRKYRSIVASDESGRMHSGAKPTVSKCGANSCA